MPQQLTKFLRCITSIERCWWHQRVMTMFPYCTFDKYPLLGNILHYTVRKLQARRQRQQQHTKPGLSQNQSHPDTGEAPRKKPRCRCCCNKVHCTNHKQHRPHKKSRKREMSKHHMMGSTSANLHRKCNFQGQMRGKLPHLCLKNIVHCTTHSLSQLNTPSNPAG